VLAAGSAIVMVATYDPADSTRAYVGTDARIQQLLVGVLLLLATRRLGGPGRWARLGAPVALAATIGAMFAVPDSSALYFRGGATVVALVFAALIWTVERVPGSAVARALSVPPVRWLGEISYGVYLWHVPVIRYLPDALPWQLPSPVPDVAAVVLTVALAAASYHLVERPVRRGRPRLVFATPRRVAGAAVGGLAACATLALVLTTWATGLQAQQLIAANQAAGAGPAAIGATGPRPSPSAASASGSPTATGTATTVNAEVCPDSTSICQRTAAAPGQPTIAVLGDSQARSLDPGFFDLARRNGWGYVLAAHLGCGLTGMLNIEGTQVPQFLRDCAAQTPGRIRQVLDQYHPDLVISLSRWELVAHLDAAGHTVQPQTAQWTQDVHAGLLSFAQTVTGSGAKLAALAVLPLAQDTPRCASRPDKPACNQVPDPLTAATNQLYDQVRGEVAGMSVISMQDVLCPANRCREAVDGLLVRYDGEHFSGDGARWFVDQLVPRLPS
jgi:hypothetical protein